MAGRTPGGYNIPQFPEGTIWKMKALFYRWGPAILWMGVILLLSLIPGSHLPEFGGEPRNILFHFAEYAILALLLLRATLGNGLSTGVISLGWAALDEWLQSFIPGRACSLKDVFVDMAGVILAFILWKRRG